MILPPNWHHPVSSLSLISCKLGGYYHYFCHGPDCIDLGWYMKEGTLTTVDPTRIQNVQIIKFFISKENYKYFTLSNEIIRPSKGGEDWTNKFFTVRLYISIVILLPPTFPNGHLGQVWGDWVALQRLSLHQVGCGKLDWCHYHCCRW